MFVVLRELFEIALKCQRFVFLKEVVWSVVDRQPGIFGWLLRLGRLK
jgi:hypothetical protein